MKMLLKKLEALIMAATYAQAQDRTSAMECLRAVYKPQPRRGQRPDQQARNQQQIRL